MEEYENEFELMDYLNVIWKKKWLIIIPTFILVVLVGIYSLSLPKVWEIDAIIVPSKIILRTDDGQFSEVLVTDPKQIAGQINQASYNNLIAAELNMNVEEFPKIEAENLRDTNLVRISIKAQDVEKGKSMLLSLFNVLKIDLDEKIKVEISGIDTQIESNNNRIKSKNIEIENKKNAIEAIKLTIKDKENTIKTKKNRIKDKQNLIITTENTIKLKESSITIKNLNIESKEMEKNGMQEEIESLQNKLVISEERITAIAVEMKDVKERIDQIEAEQQKVLKMGNDKNAIGILLYSVEIQNNLRYYNTLDEKLSNEKLTQENINLAIEGKKREIKQTDNQIEQIRTQIEDVKTEINNVKTEIDNINTQIDDINTQINDIETDIEKTRNEIKTIQNSIIISGNDIENINNDISFLKEKKARIDFAELIKEPTSSLGPVAPRKKRMVMVAGMLGLFIFTMLAFFLDYLAKQKIKVKD